MRNSTIAIQSIWASLVFGFVLLAQDIANAEPTTLAAPRGGANSAASDNVRNSEDRINQLIQKMTLAEKIGQLQQSNNVDEPPVKPGQQPSQENLTASIRRGEVGSIINEVDPATINRLQRVAVEESRLGVPLIFGRDVIHGYRTIFPIPLGQAASWNPELVQQAAAVAAREARSVGIHWTFAPMLDIARDPRWGRIAESLGEDPYLASAFSTAMVKGFQGSDLSAPDRVAACAKHFVGYGACEGGRDYNSAVISPALMHNVYLPPFRAAVDAGVATLMTSFNDINGVPGSANPMLLNVREHWGFKGFIVSDWQSIHEMVAHGYCQDDKEAAKAALLASVNMEMVSHTYHDEIPALLHEGKIPSAAIDQLVADVLRVKLRLGLFDHPFTNKSQSRLLADDHLKAARELARQSVVLLKNKNQVLPLDRTKPKKIAVIGPLADAQRAQLGTWVLDARESDSQTPLAALRESAGAAIEVQYAAGLSNDVDRSTSGFAEAVAVAKQADVVLLVVGESADLSGEARSRAVLDLPGAQNALVDAIAEVGKPTVLIVEAGRPLTIGRQIEKVDSVLYSFHAGTMAGPALADLIWGIESPSGRLPVTMPKSVGQIPLYYNHANTGRPPKSYDFPADGKMVEEINLNLGNTSNYLDVTPYPLYPFGYGLSYTTFKYEPVKLSSPHLSAGETLTIRAPITNTGKRAADEIVQLYICNKSGGAIHPVRELKGFQRIHLEPGETKEAQFSLSSETLVYYDADGKRALPLGKFEVYVGGSSLAPRADIFTAD